MLTVSPESAADLHARCFTGHEAWAAESFAALLADPEVFGVGDAEGFVLCRRVAEEAELLTLCVAPFYRQQGRGLALLGAVLDEVRSRGLLALHLEVADDNIPAWALYRKAGFVEVGRRPGYYQRPSGAVAACLLRRGVA